MKYIVCNLKSHLNEFNIKDYINTIKKITYNNVIFCVENKYISYFKDFKVCTQDYYEKTKEEYALIGHFEKREAKEEIKQKLNNAINNNIKVILCVGNDDIRDYKSLKKELSYYLCDIKKNVVIAYEPYKMIGSNNKIDIDEVEKIIKQIKKDFNNISVLYGGNVNEKNIENVIKKTDGVLIGRSSYNPHKITKILNNLRKSI